MTTRELINKLLDCPMDSDVVVLVEIHKDIMKERLNDEFDYSYPISDYLHIDDVDSRDNSETRIFLDNTFLK